MKQSIRLILVVLCSLLPMMSGAGERPLKLSTESYYTVMLYTYTTNAYTDGGVYCRLKDGKLHTKKYFGAIAKCPDEDQFRMNLNLLASRIVDHSSLIKGTANFSISEPRYPAFGRLYYSHMQGQRVTLLPRMRTYYFDANPGTITVVPLVGQDSKDAIAAAKAAMTARGYAGLDRFRFQALRAAVIRCEDTVDRPDCVLGQEVALFKHRHITKFVVPKE